jgi:hypothetical protein
MESYVVVMADNGSIRGIGFAVAPRFADDR